LLYLGPEELVSTVVIDPYHGLVQQASKANCSITPLNADGFGLAWYVPSITPMPCCFREVYPAWSSQNLKQIARVTKSHCIFAHVRAASTGNVVQTNCHPFCFKNITFMHNGTAPYYKFIKRKLQATISDRAFNMIQGTTDSEMLFAMFITNFESLTGEDSGPEDQPYSSKDHTQDMAEALRQTLHQVHKLALEYENSKVSPDMHVSTEADGADGLPYTQTIGRLNLAVTDGSSTIAARYVTSDPSTAHTLYYARGSKIQYTKEKKCCVAKCQSTTQQMVIVSSEPLGAQYECESIQPNNMVVVGPNNFFCIESCL